MRPSYRFYIICFAFSALLHSVAAAPPNAVRRQDEDQTEARSATVVSSQSPSSTLAPSGASSGVQSARASSTVDASSSLVSSHSPTSTITNQAQTSVASDKPESTSSTIEDAVVDVEYEEMTAKSGADPENSLPIHPKLTPAMGLSGVLLLLTGLVYAVIGIKNKWYVVPYQHLDVDSQDSGSMYSAPPPILPVSL